MKNLLIYGKKYHVYREGKYLGIATWIDDKNIGEAFIQKTDNVNLVIFADKWEFI